MKFNFFMDEQIFESLYPLELRKRLTSSSFRKIKKSKCRGSPNNIKKERKIVLEVERSQNFHNNPYRSVQAKRMIGNKEALTTICSRRNVAIGASVLTGIYLLNRSVKVVPASTVAYVNLFGNVSEKRLTSGIYMINPLASLVKLSLLSNNFASNTNVASNEGLNLDIQVNTIYRVDENFGRALYLKFQDKFETILIKPLVESILRTVMSSYEAKALYNEKTRNTIKDRIHKEVTSQLSVYGIIVENVLINSIQLPKQLEKSIENKLQVEQQNEQMAFTIEKRRKEIAFELEKEEMEAQRKVIEAKGIKEFQDIVSAGISDKLIKWKSIEATKDIATSPNSKVVIIGNKGSDGLPVILSDK